MFHLPTDLKPFHTKPSVICSVNESDCFYLFKKKTQNKKFDAHILHIYLLVMVKCSVLSPCNMGKSLLEHSSTERSKEKIWNKYNSYGNTDFES